MVLIPPLWGVRLYMNGTVSSE